VNPVVVFIVASAHPGQKAISDAIVQWFETNHAALLDHKAIEIVQIQRIDHGLSQTSA